MTDLGELVKHYAEVRTRLFNPPNAVKDIGINLKRKLIPPVLVVIDNHLSAKVEIIEIHNVLPPPADPKVVMLHDVLQAVARYYKVTTHDILQKGKDSRKNAISRIRHICCYIASKHTKLSDSAIGRYMNKRDHSTILNSKWIMEELLASDEQKQLQIDIRLIENALFAGHD